jgi:protein-disulfide isomerase
MFVSKKVVLSVVLSCIIVIFLIIAFVLSVINKKPKINYSSDISTIKTMAIEEIKQELKFNIQQDLYLGGKEAPVQIISYDSYSCIHCARFFTRIFPTLNEKYIKTGKLVFIHRDFPLDAQSLTASKLIKCFAKKKEIDGKKVFNLIAGIYETQQDWFSSEDYAEKLTQIFEFAGMNSKESENCIKDEANENGILEARLRSSKILKINGTPTFFINGERLEGDYSIRNFEANIEKILQNK